MELTRSGLRQGVWQGILTGVGSTPPRIEALHRDAPVPDLRLEHNPEADHWLLEVPIPAAAIAEGVQVILIREAGSTRELGSITLLNEEPLSEDLHREVTQLRAELDLLKSAFRRHCAESG